MRHKTDGPAPSGQPRGLTTPWSGAGAVVPCPLMPTMLATTTHAPSVALAPGAGTRHAGPSAPSVPAAGAAGQAFLALPFDALRFQYASAVVAGLAQRSMLASGRLERALDTLEKLVLGPLARHR